MIGVGGIQAVAALTYGAGFIPKVDKICGPGNAYVAAAKRLVYGTIDIDMVAGPSEVLVIADESANPKYIAADLLSQAEHDVLASAVLLTTSETLARKVDEEILRQSAYLSRRAIIEQSLTDFGAAIVCPDLSAWCRVGQRNCAGTSGNLYQRAEGAAAADFERRSGILGETRRSLWGLPGRAEPRSAYIRYGSVFLSFVGGQFLKTMSVLEYSRENLQQQWKQIAAFANAESLTAHANSIEVRFEDETD